MSTRLLRTVALAAALVVAPAAAHEGRPVNVQVKEREPNAFLVQWLVPKALPIHAVPAPVMPDSCRADSGRVVLDQPGAWLNRQTYRCPGGLAGESLSIHYPMYNPSLTTLVRVEFLSGERYAHVLAPGERSWIVPAGSAGAEAALRDARRAVLDGAWHVFSRWVHVAFLLALCLLGDVQRALRWVGAFAVGQVVAVTLAATSGARLASAPAEIGVAVAALLLANQALRQTEERRQLAVLVAAAGLCHGLGVASFVAPVTGGDDGGWLYSLLVVLGMDATLLIMAMMVSGLGRRARGLEWARGALAYAVGGTAVAAALILAVGEPEVVAGDGSLAGRLRGATSVSAEALPGSRRIAPQNPDLPIQSFLAIEPFEVRHEALLRLAAWTRQVGLDSEGQVEIEAQPALLERLADLVVAHTELRIDGRALDPLVDRVDFITMSPEGALPRRTPIRESIEEAVVGVTVAYVTAAIPGEVSLAWTPFPESLATIPATVIDPESSRTTTLMPERPVLSWANELSQDPVPTVREVSVEPTRLPLPLLSLALLVAAAILLVAAMRDRGRTMSLALGRVALALALVVAPLAQVSVALPGSAGALPSAGQARRILAGLLPNVYRALEFRDESAAYDRLAVSVSGETLTEVYLQHRRALELEERGGARARVEAVEVLEVGEVEPAEDGGFQAEAVWTVGGTVTHFGHRHFRQNRYDAQVSVVPVDGTWRIRSVDVLEEKRLK